MACSNSTWAHRRHEGSVRTLATASSQLSSIKACHRMALSRAVAAGLPCMAGVGRQLMLAEAWALEGGAGAHLIPLHPGRAAQAAGALRHLRPTTTFTTTSTATGRAEASSTRTLVHRLLKMLSPS